jgi:acyl-CoA synthetase (AMP-forming)/AMP-acid ligase II
MLALTCEHTDLNLVSSLAYDINVCLTASLLFRCSDVAILNDDNFLQIVGRIKDVVIRGGENIYPVEIEQFLYKHPKIADVQVK